MDPRLLEYYNRELTYLREMGAEFATQFPKIASRLGMQGIDVADPYVERLLEGFAFLAARIHVKYDAEFPRFSQRLLEVIYPNYLAPTPAMCVVKLELPDDKASIQNKAIIKAGSVMRSRIPNGERTACEFSTAHDVQLLPIEIASGAIAGAPQDIVWSRLPLRATVRASVRIRLRFVVPIDFTKFTFDRIDFFLNGRDDVVSHIYERIFSNCLGIIVNDPEHPGVSETFLEPDSIVQLGFDDSEAMLPYHARGFQGYRLLHEYFAFPARYWFFGVKGLTNALKRLQSQEFEICVLLDRECADLESIVDSSYFELHCTPAVNLTERRIDRILLTGERVEHHVVADRSRPIDYEVYSIREASGVTPENAVVTQFKPFYSMVSSDSTRGIGAYFSIRREPRLTSDTVRRYGQRTSYVGSEVFISLVDQTEAPYRTDIQHLSLSAMVTNRDLPLMMPVGGGSDFTLVLSSPVKSIKVLRGPSKPTSAIAEQEITWRLIGHLSLNYLALTEVSDTVRAGALRELLNLYSALSEPVIIKQIEGVSAFSLNAITRRLPGQGPLVFGRGVGGKLEIDESAFAGMSPYLFGAVLERYFARHVSINSFTEMSLHSSSRGEISKWPPRFGARSIA
jgi:type VI secretion system protein ImpG